MIQLPEITFIQMGFSDFLRYLSNLIDLFLCIDQL